MKQQILRYFLFRTFLPGLVVFINLSVNAQDAFLQDSKDSNCLKEQRLFDENLKYYRLVNQLNEKGEIVACELCFKPLPEPINEPDCMWHVLIDHTGKETFIVRCIDEMADFYTGNFPVPTPAPDSLFGTTAYYKWRETDFRVRCAISKNRSTVPDYYSNYGDKYVERFSRVIRNHLSREGQEWLDETLVLLQLGTEIELRIDPLVELSPQELRRRLFALHPPIYEAAGFFDLSLHDQFNIVIRLDVKDLLSKEGRIQAKELLKKFIQYKLPFKNTDWLFARQR
jgi:hypothetical protein